jgi:ketosteroid isomerase-like protein
VDQVSERDLSLLRESYGAMGLGAARPVLRLFGRLRDEAVRWVVVDLADSGRAFATRDDPVRDLFGSLPAHWELAGVEVTGMRVGGERVVVTGRFRCRPKRRWDVVSVPFAHVWTMRSCCAERVYSFLDGVELRRL